MPLVMQLQLAGANAAVLLLALALSIAPRPSDRTVYVLRMPWLSAGEARRRVEASYGIPIATIAASTIIKVVLPNAEALDRLVASSSGLVVAAAPSMLCSSVRVFER